MKYAASFTLLSKYAKASQQCIIVFLFFDGVNLLPNIISRKLTKGEGFLMEERKKKKRSFCLQGALIISTVAVSLDQTSVM